MRFKFKSKEITESETQHWREETIRTAKKLNYNSDILTYLQEIPIKINYSEIPQGMWYGYACFECKPQSTIVYSKNLSCQSISYIIKQIKDKGVSNLISFIIRIALLVVPRKVFYERYNQCGMDHELIGHIYNHLAGFKSDENAAVEVNLRFIKARIRFTCSGIPWWILSLFAHKLLYRHKNLI